MKLFYTFLLIFCFSCHSSPTGSYFIKLAPLPNEVYHYSISRTSSQQWTYQQKLNSIADTAYYDIGLQMTESMDTVLTFKLTFNALTIIPHPLKVTILNPGTTFFQNRNNPFSVRSAVCEAIKGRSVTVKLSHDGYVKEVTGLDSLFAEISKVSKIEAGTIKRTMEDHLSENALKDLLSPIFSSPHTSAVKVLDSWVKDMILTSKAPIKLSNKYELKEYKGDSAKIDIESIVSDPIDEGEKNRVKGKIAGYVNLSRESGMPYTYDTRLEATTFTDYYNVVMKEEILVRRVNGGR